jgi:HSP20 family protein
MNQEEHMQKQTEVARREDRALTRREGAAVNSPFQMLDRFASQMDELFDDFGLGRNWLSPRFGLAGWRPQLLREEGWLPDVEVLQRHNQLVIRADLPGLTRDDVKVEITDEAVTLEGERRREHEEEKAGVYRCERSYGSFRRVIALPQGAITDQAKASFKDGVLEITMPAPPESVNRGRRVDITEGSASKK